MHNILVTASESKSSERVLGELVIVRVVSSTLSRLPFFPVCCFVLWYFILHFTRCATKHFCHWHVLLPLIHPRLLDWIERFVRQEIFVWEDWCITIRSEKFSDEGATPAGFGLQPPGTWRGQEQSLRSKAKRTNLVCIRGYLMFAWFPKHDSTT